MMGWLRKPLDVLLPLLLVTSLSDAEVCHITDPIQRQECSGIAMLHGAATQIHQSVLQQLCEAGHRHVLLKGAKPSQFQSFPPTSPRRAEQFAVMYIHRDDFSDKVIWKSGEAVDIMCDDDWFVDEEVKLTNGYNWYSHGLPLWPFVNQTLTKKKKSLLSRSKKIDWPNYAIATPFYLIPSEIYNSRDPNLSIQKRFTGDFAQTSVPTSPVTFTNPAGFKERVLDIYGTLFLDQAGYARKDISADFDAYANWLQPLVKYNLQPMLESFLRTPKKGQEAICPDELYVFFHQVPCSQANTCLLLNEFQLILKLVNCPDTKMVVGYMMQGDVIAEEIIPKRTIGQAHSMPQAANEPSDTANAPSNTPHDPSNAPCSCPQVILYLFTLLGIRMSSFLIGL